MVAAPTHVAHTLLPLLRGCTRVHGVACHPKVPLQGRHGPPRRAAAGGLVLGHLDRHVRHVLPAAGVLHELEPQVLRRRHDQDPRPDRRRGSSLFGPRFMPLAASCVGVVCLRPRCLGFGGVAARNPVVKIPIDLDEREAMLLRAGAAESLDEGERGGSVWIYVQHEVHVLRRWAGLESRGVTCPAILELSPRPLLRVVVVVARSSGPCPQARHVGRPPLALPSLRHAPDLVVRAPCPQARG